MARGDAVNKRSVASIDEIKRLISTWGWSGKLQPLIAYTTRDERHATYLMDRIVATVYKASPYRLFIHFEERADMEEVLGLLEAVQDGIKRGLMSDWMAEYEMAVDNPEKPTRSHSKKTSKWLYSSKKRKADV